MEQSDLEKIIKDMEQRTVSRMELRFKYNCTDRAARRVVSEIAKRRPVISLSDGKGYRIATTYEDVSDALHAANENAKRANEILKRNEPLNKFLKNQGVGQ